MIILITMLYQPTDRYGFPCGEKESYVSHGIDSYTLNNVCLLFEPLNDYIRNGAIYHEDIGMWVLPSP